MAALAPPRVYKFSYTEAHALAALERLGITETLEELTDKYAARCTYLWAHLGAPEND